MKEMLFANPVFRKGTNLTVRKGVKWYKKLYGGDNFIIRDENNEKIAKARALEIQLDHFYNIREGILKEFEHEPKNFTKEGLLNSLKIHYTDFQEEDAVTMVFFIITKTYKETEHACPFCNAFLKGNRTVFETVHFFTIKDNFPVNSGHMLIIPKIHKPDIFALNKEEWLDLQRAIILGKENLDAKHHPDGYNLGVNCGKYAGQTVFHLHIHVFPRYKGDVENPRGGIRNFKKPLVKY